ncbi:hypothetical protein [Streptomyces mirabilis]|uniref:hypothetical protein n=1 Tax=Streptomyces mirabilis TaxID=68239 RepID=UPI0036BDEE09
MLVRLHPMPAGARRTTLRRLGVHASRLFFVVAFAIAALLSDPPSSWAVADIPTVITNLRNWIASLLDLVTFLQDHGKFPAHDPESDLRTRLDLEPGERLTVNLAVRDIFGETRQLRTKLLVANADLFNEYDRAVGEAEFRKNAVYALVELTAVLSWHHSPWWALLLVFIIRLCSAGVSSERAANDASSRLWWQTL